MVKRWKKQIEGFEKKENGTNTVDVKKAKAAQIKTQGLRTKRGRRWRHLASVNVASRRTGEFSWSTAPSLGAFRLSD
jgi:hypothetical protein